MTNYLIGVDIGTSSAKAVVVSSSGRIVAQHSAEYGVLAPQPLWAEQWPEVWLEGLKAAVSSALDKANLESGEVAALSVSSLYGGSGIPVDEHIKPLHPCLIWMDRRARDETAWVKEHISQDELFKVTGNAVDSYYGFTKILWLKHHRPEVWRKTRYLLPPNAYLIYRLTGEVAVDYSSAGNIGGVFDMTTRTWSQEMCQALGIPIELFPERLVGSAETVGKITAEGEAITGLAQGTLVCAGGVDAAVATLSAGVFTAGPHVAMLGTSMCWGFINQASPKQPGFVSMPYVIDPATTTYTFGGAATAGAVTKWFRNELGGMERFADEPVEVDAYTLLETKAAQVDPGAEGLLLLPYFAGERSPIWDPDARGALIGLRLEHTRAHLYRAFLEGVAYTLRHNLQAGREAGYQLDDTLAIVGGGARSPLWSQIFADVTGYTVRAAHSGGEAAYGDAMLAALGLELADQAALKQWTEDVAYTYYRPRAAITNIYEQYFDVYLQCYEALKPYFADMAEFQRSLRRGS